MCFSIRRRRACQVVPSAVQQVKIWNFSPQSAQSCIHCRRIEGLSGNEPQFGWGYENLQPTAGSSSPELGSMVYVGHACCAVDSNLNHSNTRSKAAVPDAFRRISQNRAVSSSPTHREQAGTAAPASLWVPLHATLSTIRRYRTCCAYSNNAMHASSGSMVTHDAASRRKRADGKQRSKTDTVTPRYNSR